ncbi:hypothetical protein KCV01_g1332, partial [Aureobasidium melanogenum]
MRLARVDGIASIVAWPVPDEMDELLPGALARPAFVDKPAQRTYDLDIAALTVAADAVGFSDAPPFEGSFNRFAMILHEQPVPDVESVAVDRQGLPGDGFLDDQRDQFFRELVGPIVVRAVRGDARKAVGMVERPYEVVRRRLGRRIGRIGGVRRRFGKPAFGAERSVDLVRGYVQEPEGGRFRGVQGAPVVSRCLEQAQRTRDVRLHEGGRSVDGPIDVRLGGEVHDGMGAVGRQKIPYEAPVADVAMDEQVTVIALEGGQCPQVAGIRQFVQVDDAMTGGDRPVDKVSADESGSAGNQ